MVITNGQMAESTWDTGKGILWTISGSTLGRMAACTRDSILKTRSMVTGSTLGVIKRSILDGGTKANSMALEYSSHGKVPNVSSAYGKTARRHVGLTPLRKWKRLRVAKLKTLKRSL